MRALAVLLVAAYHCGFAVVGGGYVGVDVFFVISGFLITSIIRAEIDGSGAFRFAHFYARRIARLFPALFVCVLLVALYAAYVTPPHELQRFGLEIVATLTYTSNIFFWLESGYFDVEAKSKLLLHTWSLSVEEQFYLLWPLLLFFLLRFRQGQYAFVSVAVLSALSLLLAVLFDSDRVAGTAQLLGADVLLERPGLDYLMTPFRLYEFGLGALLALLPLNQQTASPRLAAPLALLGLLCVVLPASLYDELTPFPSYTALLPCLGTVMLLYAGGRHGLVWLFNNRVAERIGKASYSIYLAHWPLVVTLQDTLATEEGLSTMASLALLGICLAAGFALHWLVERRGRELYTSRGMRPRTALTGAAALTVALSVPAIHANITNGWTWRYEDNLQAALDMDWRNQSKATQALAKASSSERVPNGVLIVGDSYMGDLYGAVAPRLDALGMPASAIFFDDECFAKLAGRFQTMLQSISSESNRERLDKKCDYVDRNRDHLAWSLRHADVVILQSRWELYALPHLKDFVAFAHARNPELHILVVNRRPEWSNVPELIVDQGLTGVAQIAETLYQSQVAKVEGINTSLKTEALSLGLAYFDLHELVCNPQPATCLVVTDELEVLVYDHGHWSLEGQQVYGSLILEADTFRQSVEGNLLLDAGVATPLKVVAGSRSD